MNLLCNLIVSAWLIAICFAAVSAKGEESTPAKKSVASEKTDSREAKSRKGKSQSGLVDVVRRGYLATYDGWSTDEVLLQKSLNVSFLAACKKELPNAKPGDLNWALLNARKAGKLSGTKVTKRRHDNHSAYQHLAEVVARTCQDKFRVSTDRIMCDSHQRTVFDNIAKEVAPDVEPYLLRKAAFGLRKARRLRPELVLRIADWDRKVTSHSAAELRADFSVVPMSPGVYIFRDNTGYLYIGEAINLRKRLADHLDDSDRRSLASYLNEHGAKGVTIEIHAFPADSRAKRVAVRRAYESELIASRKPRFNVRP